MNFLSRVQFRSFKLNLFEIFQHLFIYTYNGPGFQRGFKELSYALLGRKDEYIRSLQPRVISTGVEELQEAMGA